MHLPLVLPLLALLASAGGEQPNCDLSEPAALSRCVQLLLESLRDDVHQRHDPLALDDEKKCDGDVCHELTNIRIHGLASYDIDNLQVSFPEATTLALRATISWPRLRGNLDAKLNAKKRIFGRKISATLRAEPEIRLRQPAGDLDVSLRLDVSEDGAVVAVPQRTEVTIRLSDIDLDVNLKGVGRWVDFLIGSPTDTIAELVVNRLWEKKWRAKLQDEAKEALREVIAEKLGSELSKLLHRE